MPTKRFRVVTVISAYDSYVVEANDERAARNIVMDNDQRALLEARDEGLGDDLDIVEIREEPA